MKQISTAVSARLKMTAGRLLQSAILLTLVVVGDGVPRWTVTVVVGVCVFSMGATVYMWCEYWLEQRNVGRWPEQGI